MCHVLIGVQQCSLIMFLLKVNDSLATNFSGSVPVKSFLRTELSKQIKIPLIYILYLSLNSIPYVIQSDNEEIVSHNCLSKQLYCVAKFYSFVSRNKKTDT